MNDDHPVKNLMIGLDEAETFLALKKASPVLAPHFHSFHNSPDISTQNIRSAPLRPLGKRRIVQNNEGEILPKKRAKEAVMRDSATEPAGDQETESHARLGDQTLLGKVGKLLH